MKKVKVTPYDIEVQLGEFEPRYFNKLEESYIDEYPDDIVYTDKEGNIIYLAHTIFRGEKNYLKKLSTFGFKNADVIVDLIRIN